MHEPDARLSASSA